jgi:hypothetical protein
MAEPLSFNAANGDTPNEAGMPQMGWIMPNGVVVVIATQEDFENESKIYNRYAKAQRIYTKVLADVRKDHPDFTLHRAQRYAAAVMTNHAKHLITDPNSMAEQNMEIAKAIATEYQLKRQRFSPPSWECWLTAANIAKRLGYSFKEISADDFLVEDRGNLK